MDGADVRDAVASIAQGMVGDGWVRVVCPACLANDGKKRDNLAINLDTGYYQCWRCHVRGGINDTRAIGHYANAVRALERLQQERTLPSVPLPAGFTSLADPVLAGDTDAAKALRFLVRRGVSIETAHEAGIGIIVDRYKYADRVVVPVVVDGGRVCGFTARLYVLPQNTRQMQSKRAIDNLSWREKLAAKVQPADPGEIPKYVYPKNMSRLAMLNRDALTLVTQEPAILVEGAMDALPHWPNAVAFMGKPTAKQVEWICNHARRPCIVVLDGDAWREGLAAAKDMKLLGGIQVGYLRLPPKTDPGDVHPDEIRDAIAGGVIWLR